MKTYEEERAYFEQSCSKFKDSAFPTNLEFSYQCDKNLKYISSSKGLSKREYFAAMAMQGMLANSHNNEMVKPLSSATNVEIAELATKQADELIKALNNESPASDEGEKVGQ